MTTKVYEVDCDYGERKRYLRVSAEDHVSLGPLAPGAKGVWCLRVYKGGDRKNCIAAIPANGFRVMGEVELLDAETMKRVLQNVSDAKQLLAIFEGGDKAI